MPHLIKKSYNRLIACGNTLEFLQYEKPFYYNFPPTPRKAFHYIESDKKNIDRRDDNIKKSRKNLKRLITANVGKYKENPLFITYTFSDNILDPDIANQYWSLYSKRLEYFLKKRGYEKPRYITVIEFQKRGSVHYHTLYFNIPYIPYLKIELAKIWGLGFIQIKSVENIKHLASYVSKYIQKGFVDSRLRFKKAFFSSRSLFRPLYYRNNRDVLFRLDSLNVPLENENIYDSVKYGKITRKIYKVEGI